MANEIKVGFPIGKTVYVLIVNATGQFWNTSSNAFEAYAAGNLANYQVSLAQLGSNSIYEGNFPAAIGAGIYDILGKQQLGGSAAESDPNIGSEDGFNWNGTSRVTQSDLTTSGQLGTFMPQRIYRGQMLQNFMFPLISSADHVTPFTSGVVSGQIARDAGNFGALQSGAFTEVGLGFFRVTLTSGDLLANTAAVVFTGTGISGGNSDPARFSFVMQKTSGQT